jgi:dTDP-4-amino-4,6-dideoxygalactose transaminase
VTDLATIPFLPLTFHEDRSAVEGALARVAHSGWFVLGPEVEEFEAAFAAMSGTTCAVGTGNGTAAIALALRALGIGPGDEVITTALSAAFSALAIAMVGATPVFVDIDPSRLTLDPAAAEAAVGPRTRALLPVHLYGQPADMPALMAVAERHHLAVVEDCCQAHLATCEGRPVGTFGQAGAFSFYPTKNLGALGDGGAIVTNDEALANQLKRLRNGGQVSRGVHVDATAVCSRLDEIQAAVLSARLPYLMQWTAGRRSLAARYREALQTVDLEVPAEADRGHVYHLFPVRSARRNALQAYLSARGIETLVHYPVPLPRQLAFASLEPAVCPHAERVCGEILSLPLYPALSPTAIDAIAAVIGQWAPA